MLKKTITYEDWNGEERTEDFYFALNEAEIIKKNLKTPGGIEGLYTRILQTKDTEKMVDVIDELILCSYGEKSPDGRRFEKSEEKSKEFMETGAYVKLMMELFSDDGESMTSFIEGILPQKLVTQIKLAQAKEEHDKENAAKIDTTAKIVN